MRYAQIRKIDISNGDGVGVALFTQGCHFHCHNCFNQETWDPDSGQEFTQDTMRTIMDLLDKEYVTRFSILGGEPLEKYNWYQLACLINKVKAKYSDINIWVYTGYTIEKLKEILAAQEDEEYHTHYLDFILNNIDYLVDGPFIEKLYDINLQHKGSSNQRVLSKEDIHKKLTGD